MYGVVNRVGWILFVLVLLLVFAIVENRSMFNRPT